MALDIYKQKVNNSDKNINIIKSTIKKIWLYISEI